jgi:hypothetical protein
MATKWREVAVAGNPPTVLDHGVNHNVLSRVAPSDFLEFVELVASAAIIARRAIDTEDKYESVQLWQKLFGTRFPDPPRGGGTPKDGGSGDLDGGFTPRTAPGLIGGGRFA